jgi:hypothetical protein
MKRAKHMKLKGHLLTNLVVYLSFELTLIIYVMMIRIEYDGDDHDWR